MIKSNFLLRTLSGVALFVVVVASIFASKYSFALLLAVIAVGSYAEYRKMAVLAWMKPLHCLPIVIGLLVLGASFAAAAGFIETKYLALAFPALISVMIMELYRNSENPIANCGATITGIIYTFGTMSTLPFIAMHSADGEMVYTPWVILSYIFIVWANDVGAYLFGITFGRHRLFERISPKKSWEGFFGGLVVAVAVGAALAKMMDANILFWIGLAATVVVSGVFGDLVESMLKRSVNIKDSGSIIPGHGGFLDRFDALLLSAPFVFGYFIIFTNC